MATSAQDRSRTPEEEPGGKMSLGDHLRELRKRVTVAVLAVLALGVIGVVFYEPIVDILVSPFVRAAEDEGLNATINYAQVVDPFVIPLKIGLFTGIVLGAPVWIYQIWGFVTPALYRNEKKWAAAVVLIAAPLFLAGVGLCLYLLPRGLTALLGLTPDPVANIVPINDYLTIIIRLLLIFGVGFLLPVFVVLLNALGVLTGKTLSNARPWIVVGVFVFAAVATPTGDPFTLLGLAVPMWLLFEIAVGVCRLNDRRQARLAGNDIDPDDATPSDRLDELG
ncbi:MAG TPA: twin-arginine translocase subunit TatC [Jiangellaceae bacterium]|nr:twin-arginine translocase subunit TatC [Jiangellaceae bacterium]